MEVSAIGYVRNNINSPIDDNWGKIMSTIELNEEVPVSSFSGLEEFSHIEVVCYFNLVIDSKICYEKRHPRNNYNWPEIGIFAQQGKIDQIKLV